MSSRASPTLRAQGGGFEPRSGRIAFVSEPALKPSSMDAYVFLQKKKILQLNLRVSMLVSWPKLFNCMYLQIVPLSLQKYNQEKRVIFKKKTFNILILLQLRLKVTQYSRLVLQTCKTEFHGIGTRCQCYETFTIPFYKFGNTSQIFEFIFSPLKGLVNLHYQCYQVKLISTFTDKAMLC